MSLFNAQKPFTGSPYEIDDRLYKEDTSILSGLEVDGLMNQAVF